MDILAIESEIHAHSDVFPFLVSRVCQCFDVELDKNWTLDGVNQAVQIILGVSDETPSGLLNSLVKGLSYKYNQKVAMKFENEIG